MSLDLGTRRFTKFAKDSYQGQSLVNGWKYKIELSDKFHAHHHHMTCTNCGAIISFEESDSFIQEFNKLEQKHDFKSNSHSLELRGLCQSCRSFFR